MEKTGMKVFARAGTQDLARVYLAELGPSRYVEFVESVQPPAPKSEKWVLIVSTMLGCPVKCAMCDAGGWFQGKLSKDEIMGQIDFLITRSFPDRKIPVRKFKIQFARMGEPALNPAVLEVLQELPSTYLAPGLMPSLSTVAPRGCDDFFERLIGIKEKHYASGHFQLQFSLHTTDAALRDRVIPIKKWDFPKIAKFGERFFQTGDRKIGLNFAPADDFPLEADELFTYFDPDIFAVKITPVNPTLRAIENGINSMIKSESQALDLEVIKSLRQKGYEVIISIGEREENRIGSNCGQFLKRFLDGQIPAGRESYQYEIETI
jgi:23S rRNA (adenine2503-C2)-methyltransferase